MKLNNIMILIFAVLFLVACKDNNVEKVDELLSQIEKLQESIKEASNSSKNDDENITVNASKVDKEQALQNMVSDLEAQMQELKVKNEKELALMKNEVADISSLVDRLEKGTETLDSLKDNLTAQRKTLQDSIDSSKSEFEAKKAEISKTISGLESQLTEKKDNATKMESEVVRKQNELIANELKESTANLTGVTTTRREEGNAHNEYHLKYTDREVTVKFYDNGAKDKETLAKFTGVSGIAYKREYSKSNEKGKIERDLTEYLDSNKKLYSGTNTSYYGYERTFYYNLNPSEIKDLPQALFELVSLTPSQIIEDQYKGNDSGVKQSQKLNMINFSVEVLLGGFQINLVAQETSNLNGATVCNTEKQRTTQASPTSWNFFPAGDNNKFMQCYAFKKGLL